MVFSSGIGYGQGKGKGLMLLACIGYGGLIMMVPFMQLVYVGSYGGYILVKYKDRMVQEKEERDMIHIYSNKGAFSKINGLYII